VYRRLGGVITLQSDRVSAYFMDFMTHNDQMIAIRYEMQRSQCLEVLNKT